MLSGVDKVSILIIFVGILVVGILFRFLWKER